MAQEPEWSRGASVTAGFDDAVCALLMGGDSEAIQAEWRAPKGPVAAGRSPAWAAFAKDEERALSLPSDAVREWKAWSGLRALDEEGLRRRDADGSVWPDWPRWADLMDCGAGGNCFFLSASYALFGHVGAARALRALACAGATRLTDATAEARVEAALRVDEYATDDLIWGLCSAVRVRVQIVDVDDERCPVYRFGGDDDERPVATLFGVGLRQSGGGHFCALVPRDDGLRERAQKRARRSPSPPSQAVQREACDCERCRP